MPAKLSACIIHAGGCPRSNMDTAKLYRYLDANGWRIVDQIKKAQLLLVSTCGVDTRSEERSMASLELINTERAPNSKLIVLGCLAGIQEDAIKNRFGAETVPPVRLHELDSLIGAKVLLEEIHDEHCILSCISKAGLMNPWPEPVSLKGRFSRLMRRMPIGKEIAQLVFARKKSHTAARHLEPAGNVFHLRVAAGCMGVCSYCAIRLAAGPLRSKPLQGILDEFDEGLRQGHKEFNIIAGDIACYGQDIGLTVVDLFEGFFARQGDFRLTLLDLGPEWGVKYTEALTRLFVANSARIRLVVFPVQSGCDRILEKMERGYSAETALAFMERLHHANPPIQTATHVMAGFPGETEADFEETLAFLRKARFNRVDVYRYNDRPGTEAIHMDEKISEQVQAQRLARIEQEFGIGEHFPTNGRVAVNG